MGTGQHHERCARCGEECVNFDIFCTCLGRIAGSCPNDGQANSAPDGAKEYAQARRPTLRPPPNFPDKCLRGRKSSFEVQIDVEFDIAIDGSVENIRVIAASNDCFIDAAIAADSKWKYNPPVINGEPGAVANEQARITFQYDDGSIDRSSYTPMESENSALTLTLRMPPIFHQQCVKGRKEPFEAYVDLEFDVNSRGRVRNIRVVGASDECFAKAATKAVSKWKFEPPAVNGEREDIFGEKTRVRIRFPGVREKSPPLDPKVARQMGDAFEKMQEGDNLGALEILDALLADRRDQLKPFDLATTLEFRGSIKANLEDYEGALKDFEDAYAIGAMPQARQEQLIHFIEQLKTALAQSETEPDGRIQE